MLNVQRLTKTYQAAGGRDLTVLKEVSFSLTAGASLAIVGPSGSGKTTLLGLCAGLDQPTTGTVELAGESIGATIQLAIADLGAGAAGSDGGRGGSGLLFEKPVHGQVVRIGGLRGVPLR